MRSHTPLPVSISLFFLTIIFYLFPFSLYAMEGKELESEGRKRFIGLVSSIYSEFADIEKDKRERFPHYFRGEEKLDKEIIEQYRESWVNFKGKNQDLFDTLHNPSLLSLHKTLQQNLEDYAETHQAHTTVTRRFLREIQFYYENEGVSPCWLENLPFRFLCAISANNPHEKDLFTHFPYPHSELFLALQEHESWKSHEATVKSLQRFKNHPLAGSRYAHGILSSEAVFDIENLVNSLLPLKVVYSLWGESKMGAAFIVKRMLEDIFVIGLPLKNLTAHGVILSPYGFAFHDHFHKAVDHRREAFIQYIVDQAEAYVEEGGSIRDFCSTIIPSLIPKYSRLMGALQEICQRLIENFDQLDSRKAMLGFFWILHEEPNFPNVIYSLSNFDDILSVITEDDGEDLENADDIFYITPSTLPNVEQKKLFEDPVILAKWGEDDPFETSPIDGTSLWTDEQIIHWVIQHKKVWQARKYAFMAYDDTDDVINTNDVIETQVTRSSRYIDIIFTLRQGGQLTYSFQTLFYSFHALHESLKLLNLIDIKIDLPDLATNLHPRAEALYFIKKAERTMESLIRHFRKVASSLAHEDSEKGSLIQRYEQFYNHL